MRLPQEIQESKSYQKVANVMMRIREEAAAASNPGQEPSSAGKKDSYRISNTIKMKDGREIVLRGSPRCFPIWFCSSGDVFADWTALPGASKLQAHLNALYENKKYTEYVDVVETSIQENWRRVIYGEEDFTIGSFGINAATGKSSDDGPVRGASSSSGRRARSTRQAGKRNTDEGTSQFGSPLGWRQTDSGVVPVELRGAPLSDHGAAAAAAERIATCGPSHEQLKGLWQQLIVTALAMGVLAMEQKHFDKGLSLFHQAERWTKNDELLDSSAVRKHCRAHCKDAMACYFFKVGKPFSAVSYAEAAMELYEGARDMEGVAVCLLHLSAIYSQLGEFKKAHKLIFEFLAMVEGGRLSDAAPSPKQLCLVAVGYHNLGKLLLVRAVCQPLLFLRRCPMSLTYLPSHRIASAVVQLKLNVPDLACKNSQNARKIARLCLSYSNRWIDVFRYTHSLAVADIKWELRTKQLADLSPMQIALIAELAEALFDPDFDALHKGDAAIVT
jgi:tetratricopeptide (TPR) repeat protein